MIPILYAAGESVFDTNGIGMLPDIGSVKVEQELNGMYELTLRYPMIGLHAAEITDRSIIMVKPDPVQDPQPFRVYRINPVSAGTITAYARHLAYDMSGIVAAPFTANSAAEAMVALPQAATSPCPFTFETDKDTSSSLSYPKPRSLWRTLGGSEGSILDTYGGEYEFDQYKVKLWKRRGLDRGVTIRYGKNLRTLEQDRNCAEVYTGCYPYWYNEEEGLVELPNRILQAEGTYAFERIYELDLSSEWQEKPTAEQLEARARKWMKDNDIGIPKISWKIEFLQLEQTEEYKEKALLERVLLGDTVHVIFPEMGVNVSSRVVRIDYDPVNERYNSITLGRVKQSLADTIIHQQQEIGKKPDKQQVATMVTAISSKLSDALTGALGGAVRLLDTDGDGMPDELYIADNPSPAFAKKVWRFNYMGWAASKQGYNGPWEFGATLEEGLLAAFVTVAHLTGGTIQSKDGESFFIDLDNGIVRIKAIQDMVTEIQDMGTDMSQMEQRLSSQIDQTAEGIRTEVSTVSTEVRQEVNEIYGDLNTANDRIDGLGNRLDQQNSQITAQGNRIDQQDSQINAQNNLINQQNGKINANGSQIIEQSKKIAAIDIKADNISAKVEEQTKRIDSVQTSISTINQRADGIESIVKAQDQELDSVRESVTSVNQRADGFELWVQTAETNGVTKTGVTRLNTKFGVTIDESDITVSRQGEEMTNSINEKGIYGIRNKGTQYEEVMLQVDPLEVSSANLRARKYLIVGNNSRIEDYRRNRSALFYIGD